MNDFWIDDNGTNLLSGAPLDPTTGLPTDPNNPPLLSDSDILDFLVHIPAARASFDRLLPTMLPVEQTRLNGIANIASVGLVLDPVKAEDIFQHRINIAGVQRGGGWRPTTF